MRLFSSIVSRLIAGLAVALLEHGQRAQYRLVAGFGGSDVGVLLPSGVAPAVCDRGQAFWHGADFACVAGRIGDGLEFARLVKHGAAATATTVA